MKVYIIAVAEISIPHQLYIYSPLPIDIAKL
jgi:hypothetical protein